LDKKLELSAVLLQKIIRVIYARKEYKILKEKRKDSKRKIEEQKKKDDEMRKKQVLH
jgi:hypothetical protein